MRTRNRCAGSAVPAVFLALLILILVVSTVYIFMVKKWWFPPPITELGGQIDHQFVVTLVATGIVFVLSQLGLAWAVVRFRDRGQKATFSRGNNVLEVLWTLLTFILFVSLGLMAKNAWAQVHFREAAPDALPIEVTGQQFAWNFRYPGPDKTFGRTDVKFVDASVGNPVGIDPNDPAGKDDIVVPVLVVPVNQEVQLTLLSQDVIHSFYVRELRLKQDLVPGMVIPIHFRPEKVGEYEIACAELCGLGHYRMHSCMQVVAPEDYQAWLAGGGQALQRGNMIIGACQ
ncbi:MAG: cytochrome c oxidase subunit II [Candidatus Acidiferrales bacterium]